MAALLTLLGGLFGGAGATILWELWLKPARERRAITRLLLLEIQMNRRIIELIHVDLSVHPTPLRGFYLHTKIFDSSAARLADISGTSAALTYWTHRYFERLMWTAQRHWNFLDRHQGNLDSPNAKRFIEASRHTWATYLSGSLVVADKARTALEASLLPPWSSRRRELRAAAAFNASDVATAFDLPDAISEA